jgi:hypothetical protein
MRTPLTRCRSGAFPASVGFPALIGVLTPADAASTQDVPRTALEAGNSTATIFSHYGALATEAEGKVWFGIRPEQAMKDWNDVFWRGCGPGRIGGEVAKRLECARFTAGFRARWSVMSHPKRC